MPNIIKPELALDVDVFNKPKVYKDAEAIANILINFLYTTQSMYPNHPDLFIDISKYNMKPIEDSVYDLQEQLNRKIPIFAPELAELNIKVSSIDKSIVIYASREDLATEVMVQVTQTNDGLLAEYIQ